MASWSTPSAGRSMPAPPPAAARRCAGRAAGKRRPRCSGTTQLRSPPRRSNRMVTYRVGVDIGGTFTDIVLLGSDGTIHTKKISSSVDNYASAIVQGLDQLFPAT